MMIDVAKTLSTAVLPHKRHLASSILCAKTFAAPNRQFNASPAEFTADDASNQDWIPMYKYE
jgi:hypothetical protein